MAWQLDHPWRHTFVVWPRRSISNTWVNGTIMVRRVKGKKQYRAMDDVEAWELWLDSAW